MITEDYCYQEVVKLLKEKGFPFGYNKWVDEDAPILISQPIVCKWLREVHKLFVDISFVKDEDRVFWYYAIFELSNDNAAHYNNVDEFATYEEAVEAAIKFSLENLI